MLGLLASVALAHGSIVKALAMIVLGLLLGLVGQDIYSGQPRFTFGRFELYSGINFVSVAVGVFGLAEILRNLEHETVREVAVKHVKGLWLSKEDFKRIIAPVVRGTALIGAGVLPGGGHVPSSFASYSLEKGCRTTPASSAQRHRGRGGAGIGQQRRRPDLVHPDADPGHPGPPGDGADDRAFIIQGITPAPTS